LLLYDIKSSKAIELAQKIANYYPKVKVRALARLDQGALDKIDVIYNGSGIGKKSNNSDSIYMTPLPDTLEIPSEIFAIDSNYTPLETLFLKQCRLAGCQTLNGFSHMVAFTPYIFQKFYLKI